MDFNYFNKRANYLTPLRSGNWQWRDVQQTVSHDSTLSDDNISASPSRVPPAPFEVKVSENILRLGGVSVSFMRTLRIPDDGKEYPLPPSLGAFPLRRAADYSTSIPSSWSTDDIFLPMYQREAMWLSFLGSHWRPNALRVVVGGICALSGKPFTRGLHAPKNGVQDYLVIPNQPWLDGINSGDGSIKQFVAMTLGDNYTVEGQLTGEERVGGLSLHLFDSKKDRFPNEDWQCSAGSAIVCCTTDERFAKIFGNGRGYRSTSWEMEMGLGAGGVIRQKIYADPYGPETWDEGRTLEARVHLVNSELWASITGEAMPKTAVTAKEYARHKYPWFDLYDEERKGVKAAKPLKRVKSVRQIDEEKGVRGVQDDSSVKIEDAQIQKLQFRGTKRAG